MRNYTTKGTNAENFMQISLLLKKIWYLKDSRNGHFAMHYSSFLVLGREGPYFVKEHSDLKNKYTADDIINMLEFLVDNIFVVFGGKVFQQIVGIPMGIIIHILYFTQKRTAYE